MIQEQSSASVPASPPIAGADQELFTRIAKVTGSSAMSIKVIGNLVMVGSGATLRIFSQVKDNGKLVGLEARGQVDTRGVIREIAVFETDSNRYVLTASGSEGLQVFQVNDINAPVQYKQYKATGDESVNLSAMGLAVAGNYVYVAYYDGGVHRLSLANIDDEQVELSPDKQLNNAQLDTPNGPYYAADVTVQGRRVYVGYTNATSTSGAFVVADFKADHDNNDPEIIYCNEMGATTNGGGLCAPAVEMTACAVTSLQRRASPQPNEGYIFASCGIANILFPPAGDAELVAFKEQGAGANYQVQELDSFDTGYTYDAGEDLDVVRVGNVYRIYLASGFNQAPLGVSSDAVKLIELDVSEQTPILVEKAAVPNLDLTLGISVAGNYAFVADEWAGLLAYPLDQAGIPSSNFENDIIHLDTGGFAIALAANGNQLAVGDEGAGMQLVDISEPATMPEPDLYSHREGWAFVEAVDVDSDYIVSVQGPWPNKHKVRILNANQPEQGPIADFVLEKKTAWFGHFSVARHQQAIYVGTKEGIAVVTDWASAEACGDDCPTPTIQYLPLPTEQSSTKTYALWLDESQQLLWRLYKSGGKPHLEVLDISVTPTAPDSLTTTEAGVLTVQDPVDLYVGDQAAFVALPSGKIAQVGYALNNDRQVACTFDKNTDLIDLGDRNPQAVSLGAGMLFVGYSQGRNKGVMALDLANLSGDPLGEHSTVGPVPGFCNRMDLLYYEQHLYVADQCGGTYVLTVQGAE